MLPLRFSLDEDAAFRHGFSDELSKLAAEPALLKELLIKHGPGVAVGAAGLHYGKQVVDDLRQGRAQRRAIQGQY